MPDRTAHPVRRARRPVSPDVRIEGHISPGFEPARDRSTAAPWEADTMVIVHSAA